MSGAFFDRPVLVVDPGMHAAMITCAATDRDGIWAVTGSDDKTVRVWSLTDGKLERTIRLPAGSGDIGKVYAVALSPDGTLIAAGGWTRSSTADRQEQIYLFDRATGALKQRIKGLPDVVNCLTFCFLPNGGRLAAMVGNGGGLRVYEEKCGWAEVARDEVYRYDSYGADFALDGWLATTSYDGGIRLYLAGHVGTAPPLTTSLMRASAHPHGIAVSPDGARLAVGYSDTIAVTLLDRYTLAILPSPDTGDFSKGGLGRVAWSCDGGTLWAGGTCTDGNNSRLFAWDDGGSGKRRVLCAGRNTVTDLVGLPGGDLVVAAADPYLARLGPDGTPRWAHRSKMADFRRQMSTLLVSEDGACLEFGYMFGSDNTVRFDVAARCLSPASGSGLAAPVQAALKVDHWLNGLHPTLNGKVLPMMRDERSRSLAIHPTSQCFVLGTEWWLRAFDANGELRWKWPVPGAVWAVNISGDGRLIVAAYGDGTIRWHRITDGVELLAFMPFDDRSNWVAWTPEGFYAATAEARDVLRWHVNRGWDSPADSVAVENIPGAHRPSVLPLVLQELETPRALGLADLEEYNRQVMVRTNSSIPPGARLHVLTIGINIYNAARLRLRYARQDAEKLADTIRKTQGALYSVESQVLLDGDASKKGILRALRIMRNSTEKGSGADLAVIHFSGHGAMIEGRLYLLPADVDVSDETGVRSSAMLVDDLRNELLEIAKYGRVLALVDACHSGAVTVCGRQLRLDATALQVGLAMANVSVLTSSSGSEISLERAEWGHGAFTKILVDAFNDPDADLDRNRLITAIGLAKYVTNRVSMLTDSAQNPGMELRFAGTLFASNVQ